MTMKKITVLTLFFLNMLSIMATNLPSPSSVFNTIDLELNVNSQDLNPAIYNRTSASFTITNNGSELANNLTISIPIPDGFVLTGSNPFELTGGSYSDYFGNWELSSLAPGASETLTLNIYVLTEDQVDLYGEVSSVDEADVDSTPDNGTPPNPSEDDEAVLNFNEVVNQNLPDLTVDQLEVPSLIQFEDVTEIEYRLRNLGEADAVGPFTAYFYYSTDNQLNFGDPQVGQKSYNSFSAGSGMVEIGTIFLRSSDGVTLGEGYIFVVIDNDNSVVESNEENNISNSAEFFATTILPNRIDLELSLDQPNDQPEQYSTYSVELSLFNNSPLTATNVEVNVLEPAGVVYSGGNPFETNKGTFSTYSGVYAVESVLPYETVTLSLNYFLLEEEDQVAFAEVIFATELDADSSPGNGTPPTPFEDDEASTDDNIIIGLPDLLVTQIEMPPTIRRGEETLFNYRLENLGTATAGGSFDIYYYYSSDNQLNLGDQQIGQASFSNLSAGGSLNEVDIIFLLESFNIPLGPGYIILNVDNNNSIEESNENNNVVVTAVNILPEGSGPECATNLGVGSLNCIENTPNGGKIVKFATTDVDGTFNANFKEIDANGELIDSGDLGEIEREVTYQTVNDTDQNNILQKIQNGIPLENKTIPNSIMDNYELILGATAFNDGFMIFARNEIGLFAILTDENLNPITNNLIPSQSNFLTIPDLNKAIQISSDQVAFVFSERNGQAGSITSLLVINDALEVLSAKFLISNQYSSGNIEQTICGDYQVTSSAFTPNCMGQCNYGSTEIGDFVNGEFISESLNGTYNRDPANPSEPNTFSFTNILNTLDGGRVVASGGTSFGPNQVLVERTLNGEMIFSKTIELEGGLIRMMEISGVIYFLVYDATNQITRYYDLDCLEDVSNLDGVDLELTSALSVDAPDIYSNYSVVYTLVNNGTEDATGIEVSFIEPDGTVYRGSNPFSISRGDMSSYNNLYTLDELPAGETAVIELNYFSLTDSPINHYAEVIAMNEDDLDSTPNNGTPLTVNEDDETAISTEASASTNSIETSTIITDSDRLEILKLYPNPIMEKDIRMTLTFPESKEQTLLIYNELGVEVLRTSFDLSNGFNEIILPTKDLNAGMYRVILPGHPMRFGSASFIVIR